MRRAPSSATTSAASPTRSTCRSARRRTPRSLPRTSVWRRGCATPSPSIPTTTWSPPSPTSWSTVLAAPNGRASLPSASSWTPVSTWGRPGSSRSSFSGRRTGSRRWATRCCSRRRTRRSSDGSSSSRSTSATRPPWPRPPWASPSAAGSSGPTTSRARAGCVTCSPPCSRQREVTATELPVYLVRGDDAVLTGDAVRQLVTDLVGDVDPVFAVEELAGDDYEIAAVVEAAQTPPFFGTRRVVVARSIGRFSAQEVAALVAYLADPLPTTALVLVSGGGQIARGLLDAVKKAGHVLDAGAPSSGKARQSWLASQLKASPVNLDPRAADLVATHLGEDVGRLPSLLELLTAAYGEGARLGEDDLAPFLGEAGGVAPWDLT